MSAQPDAADPAALTPLRRQYLQIKRRHPGMILLFQIGDFYETFDDDAEVLARDLGVALTRKWFGKDDVHPLAGIPVRALTAHLGKLLRRGHKVALCEQVTPPGKGLVEREVTRIITPGTVVEPGLLEGRESNYLAALVPGEGRLGLACADISTGEFRTTELPAADALAELSRLRPAELLAPAGLQLRPAELPDLPGLAITPLPDALAEPAAAREAVQRHFAAATLDALGCAGRPLALRAAGLLLRYLGDTQPDALLGLTQLQAYGLERHMVLDPTALRHLEVFGPTASLLQCIDCTRTPMGGRLLRAWLRYPLLDLDALRARQAHVAWFHERPALRAALREVFGEVLDLERLLGRARRRLAVPAEVLALGSSLRAAGQARALLEKEGAPAELLAPLQPCADLVDLIARALHDRPVARDERAGPGVIREGFSRELDELRAALHSGRRFLGEFEERERQRSGIRSLKVGYHKVFGYYIEVTRPNLRLVPPEYIRKQTLAHAERFYTAALKEQEALIASARDGIEELEQELFRRLCEELGGHHGRLLPLARGIAALDVYAALAEDAGRRGYVRPELHEGEDLDIRAGRHPLLEAAPGEGEDPGFVPNDTHLGDAVQIILLTAPNMAGKSVYLRQVGLICLLAQIGAFVPARAARLPIIDRIFTRIGQDDTTASRRSTFMSEMVETAQILHQATPRSLVLLDEVGRGTATGDGLAVAQAVIEHLHNHPRLRCKTLFSTHYHELTACAGVLPRVRNYHLVVREEGGEVRYLHRVEPGRAEKSFGLHVAKLAGLPGPVLRRARDLLAATERGPAQRPAPSSATEAGPATALVHRLSALDLDGLSPIEALTQLYELQAQARVIP